MKNSVFGLVFCTLIIAGCQSTSQEKKTFLSDREAPFLWDNATVYFLLTDRFANGDTTNDVHFDRTGSTGILRGFQGGDFEGIIQKIQEGYFDNLGVTALWFSPVMEQIHGKTDEGTGDTYAYHGYWAKDWTHIEPNWGTSEELTKLIETAHAHGIRIIMDVVLNHTGPPTEKDPVWPSDWVRMGPTCRFESYETSVPCTLVDNLADIRTESDAHVDLPPFLLEKWEREGRLDQELEELDHFFMETGFPRAPRYYLMKWVVDLIRDFGIDGLRIDTARHVEEEVWAELKQLADRVFLEWKAQHPDKVLDDSPFYMVGEVYGYQASANGVFDFGDIKVDYSQYGFTSLINFEFKGDAQKSYEKLFSKYSNLLNAPDNKISTLHYISSHDDSWPFDIKREQPRMAGTKLMLCPGSVQVYYGDELARPLEVEGAIGDANLRSKMNWEDLENDVERNGVTTTAILDHWQKLGRFRKAHPAVGAGVHKMISKSPYSFSRTFETDAFIDVVVVGMDLKAGRKEMDVSGIFEDGTVLKDYYSDQTTKVKNGRIFIESEYDIILVGL